MSTPPRVVDLPAFTVVGVAGTYASGGPNDIPLLWDRFISGRGAIRDVAPEACLGLCFPGPPAPGGTKPATFEYVACAEVRPAGGDASVPEGVPAGMVVRHVPAQRYAVFTYRGHVSGIAAFYDEIYVRLLPASGHAPAAGPDFERYDDRFDGATASGEVDIHVPVVRTGS